MPIDVKANGVAQLLPPKGRAAYLFHGRYYDVGGYEVPDPDGPAPRTTARQARAQAAPTPPAAPTSPAAGAEAPGDVTLPEGTGTDDAGVPDFANMPWKGIRKAYKERFGHGLAPGKTAADARLELLQSYGSTDDWNTTG